jgi:menaquinol-cytochrome c reductase iron-sulfur subunit
MNDPTQRIPEPAMENMPRRAFHLAVIYILGDLIGVALAIPTLIYLLAPPKTRKDTGWVDAGDLSQLTPGTPVEISFQQSRVDGWRVVTEKKTAWVVKESDNSVVAFGPQCTHLGCAYHWDEGAKQFACPCHASFFALDGKVMAGPAPRPLDRYSTRVQDNRLQLGALRPSNERNG